MSVTAQSAGTRTPQQIGVLRLEGEAKGRDGVVAKYVIEGKLENDALGGSFAFGSGKGNFKFTRK